MKNIPPTDSEKKTIQSSTKKLLSSFIERMELIGDPKTWNPPFSKEEMNLEAWTDINTLDEQSLLELGYQRVIHKRPHIPKDGYELFFMHEIPSYRKGQPVDEKHKLPNINTAEIITMTKGNENSSNINSDTTELVKEIVIRRKPSF